MWSETVSLSSTGLIEIYIFEPHPSNTETKEKTGGQASICALKRPPGDSDTS